MCPNTLRAAPGTSLFSQEIWSNLADSLKLSGRELEIIRLVFEERTELEIAQACEISRHTVHTHLERLYHKLAVHSRVGLVLRVVGEFLTLSDLPRHAAKRPTPNVAIVPMPSE